MPTYEYVCDECHHEFELFHSMKDDPIKICPECHQEKVRRVIGSGAGIIFKGSGFYETDYKRKSSNGSAESGSKGSSSGKSASADTAKPSSTESKPQKAETTA